MLKLGYVWVRVPKKSVVAFFTILHSEPLHFDHPFFRLQLGDGGFVSNGAPRKVNGLTHLLFPTQNTRKTDAFLIKTVPFPIGKLLNYQKRIPRYPTEKKTNIDLENQWFIPWKQHHLCSTSPARQTGAFFQSILMQLASLGQPTAVIALNK